MPNKRDVRNPKTENMLAMFEFVVCGVILLHDGSRQYFIYKLTETQKDIFIDSGCVGKMLHSPIFV